MMGLYPFSSHEPWRVRWGRLQRNLYPSAIAILLILTQASSGRGMQHQEISTADACGAFKGNNIWWDPEDCTAVWESFVASLPMDLRRKYVDRGDTASVSHRLRSQGGRCFVQLPPMNDGVGSSAIRSIATWVFAEEMGCEWVHTNWGVRQIDDSGMMRYCHSSVSTDQVEKMTIEERHAMQAEICNMVNWRQVFGFDAHSVDLPRNESFRTLTVRDKERTHHTLFSARSFTCCWCHRPPQ